MVRHRFVVCLVALISFAGCSDKAPPEVVVGTFDPSRSTVEVDRSAGVVADGLDAPTVTVTVRDEDGNPLPGAVVRLAVTGDAVTLSDVAPTDGSGVARATLTTLRAQTVTVSATVGDVTFAQTPTVAFVAGPAAALTFAVPPGAVEAGAVIAPAVQVAVVDAHGNRVLDATSEIFMALDAGASATLLGSTTAVAVAGLATFSDLRINEAGTDYALVASSDVAAVKSLPFVVTVGAPAKLAFTTPPADAVAGAALSSVAVELTDAHGNRARGAQTPVTLALGASAGEASLDETTTVTPVDGVATFSNLVVRKAGSGYTLVASAQGFAGAESSAFAISLAPLDAARSGFTLNSGSAVADGVESLSLTFHAEDSFGNAISGVAVSLASSVEGDALASGTTDGSGVFTATLTTTTAGTRTITADVSGAAFTAEVSFTAGAPTAGHTSLVVGSSSVTADGIASTTFTVVVEDAHGNAVSGQLVSLEATGSANTFTPATGETDSTGAFTGALTSTKAEVKTVTATIGSITSEATVTFVPGAPDAERSSVSVPPTLVPADGVSTAQVSVLALDAFGNVVAGAPVSLAVSGTGNTVTQPAVTDATGRTSGAVGSSVAETKTIRVSVDGVELVDAPQVAFRNVFSIAGTVTGLVGSGLLLANGDVDFVEVTADGAFSFGTKLESGSSYAVTVATQPTNQLCTVSKGSGVVGSTGVDDIEVTCVTIWKTIVSGPSAVHTLGLKFDGTLWAWGRNATGQLGDGTTTDRSVPVPVLPGTSFTAIAAGAAYSLALKDDGTLWAWGSNFDGQLGGGTTDWFATAPVPVLPGTTFNAVAAGLRHALALEDDGTLWAWGNNSAGQLGDGSNTSRNVPAPVLPGTTFTDIAAGGDHTLALKDDGTLWAWGGNYSGQLGDGSTTNRKVPAPVLPGTTLTAIAAGESHSFALKADGTLWAWGENAYCQLGNGSCGANRSAPVAVLPGTRFTDVAAGRSHSLALKEDGTLWAWGTNTYGQLGDGDTMTRPSPVRVLPGTRFQGIAAGVSHSLAIKEDGTLWAWGWNLLGQLGDGTTTNRNVPVPVLPGTTPSDIAAGDNH